MISAQGVRIGWADLPERVRAALEAVIGDRVVRAVSQPGGFSPGTADRVVTATGRRAFVKAVSTIQNADSPRLHRREIEVTAALPSHAAVPRLLGSYDDGTWVALVLEDIDGRHPATPWQADELAYVLAATKNLAADLTPSPLPDLPSAADSLASEFAGWIELRADPPPSLDPWAVDHLDMLCELAETSLTALVGDTLVLLINVAVHGGHDHDALLVRQCGDVEPSVLTGVLAGMAAFFLDNARRPAPPGLPTLRSFQAAQGEITLAWVRDRLSNGRN